MNADQVIDLRKSWAKYSYGSLLPAATLLAEHDWTSYVQAMTATVPSGDSMVWPTVEETHWSWPEGLVVVFSGPMELNHTIISKGEQGAGVVKTKPHQERQVTTGLVILPEQLSSTQSESGIPFDYAMPGRPILWIGEDPSDTVSGWWLPGVLMKASGADGISESSRFFISILTALGHRLTRLDQPVVAGRGEKRRIDRELPSLRVLQLSTGATVKSNKEPGKVEWTHRWITRGHWRQQPCGPRLTLRRLIWIDPYVKGPEHLPLDVRPTVWRTGGIPA